MMRSEPRGHPYGARSKMIHDDDHEIRHPFCASHHPMKACDEASLQGSSPEALSPLTIPPATLSSCWNLGVNSIVNSIVNSVARVRKTEQNC